MKKIAACFAVLTLCVFFCALPVAGAEEEVVFGSSVFETTLTKILHTGDDLALPRISAKRGNEDLTGTVTVTVFDGTGKRVNEAGSFVAENLAEGTYSVQYAAGGFVCGETLSVKVSDDCPSVSLEASARPASEAFRDVAYRVRAIGAPEGASVAVTLTDGTGKIVDTAEQREGARSVTLTPKTLGWGNVTYAISASGGTVLCSFPVWVDIRDFEGDFLDCNFEGDDWIDAYNIAYWSSAKDSASALSATVSSQESRSGKSSLKFSVLDLSFQPTLFFRLDFIGDRQMRKDDKTEYVLRFWVKRGEDFAFSEADRIPVFDFHILAKKSSSDTHYGVYKWQLGNFALKAYEFDDWTLCEYRFVSFSDEYVFGKDWLGTLASADYTSYQALQIIMVPTNVTGSIYIDDVQLFKAGASVDDPIVTYPHDAGGGQKPGDTEPGRSCGSAKTSGLLGVVLCLAAFPFLKRS